LKFDWQRLHTYIFTLESIFLYGSRAGRAAEYSARV
jgi:hypothetical protein